jgi:uridylate kinase
MLKATKVDGVYDSDPAINSDAKLYKQLTYDQVLGDKLSVMDATAIVMCRDNKIPLRVFNMFNQGDLKRIALGEDVGTSVVSE